MNARTEAADRIAAFAREGRLVQDAWHDEQDGRELACLLGAIGPEVKSPEDCPASVMPAWLAHLRQGLVCRICRDVVARIRCLWSRQSSG